MVTPAGDDSRPPTPARLAGVRRCATTSDGPRRRPRLRPVGSPSADDGGRRLGQVRRRDYPTAAGPSWRDDPTVSLSTTNRRYCRRRRARRRSPAWRPCAWLEPPRWRCAGHRRPVAPCTYIVAGRWRLSGGPRCRSIAHLYRQVVDEGAEGISGARQLGYSRRPAVRLGLDLRASIRINWQQYVRPSLPTEHRPACTRPDGSQCGGDPRHMAAAGRGRRVIGSRSRGSCSRRRSAP